ncbi:MAG: Ldh family oxidoreductase [Candidatus Hodarchaeota archaeon]
MEENIYKIEKGKLYNFCDTIFKKLNLSSEETAILIDSIIQADMRGIHTHGVMRIPIYVKRFQLGLVNIDCTFKIVEETSSMALLDGNNGIGQVIGTKAMEIAITKALGSGIGCVGVKNSNHFGAAAYFSSMALKKDMIGIAMTNTTPLLAPTGGTDKLIGNNPISIAIPSNKELPIILDSALSVVALGKIMLAQKKGETIPLGWGLDKFGKDTDDPNKVLEGGIILPIGAYKGYGLSLIIEILTGVLTGSGYSDGVKSIYKDLKNPNRCGHLFVAIRIQNFIDLEQFKTRIDDLIKKIKNSPKLEGVQKIYLPGEIEFENEEKSLKEGIALPKQVIEELEKLAKGLDLNLKLV